MTYAQSILPEFDQEMANTRKVLELVPEDKFDWQATESTHTLGWNANHLADILSWAAPTLVNDSFDVHPPGGEMYQTPTLATTKEILELFDKNVTEARAALEEAVDEKMGEPWSLLQQGETLMTMPRAAVIRGFVMNHIVHHRAILITYLRLNGISAPGMYGPGDSAAS